MPKSKRKRTGGLSKTKKSRRAASARPKRSKGAKKSARKHKVASSQRRQNSKRKQIRTFELPKTRSKETSPLDHKVDLGKNHHDIAYDEMTLTQLQIMARNRGIPFGGLPREKLIRKINIYK
ncbi:TATA box-binding protein [Faustovirus]|nr:TATA box-binding protein [Faustovirus]